MLAQLYADDKEKVALLKSALAVRGRDCLMLKPPPLGTAEDNFESGIFER